jgi:hypothetical protein
MVIRCWPGRPRTVTEIGEAAKGVGLWDTIVNDLPGLSTTLTCYLERTGR